MRIGSARVAKKKLDNRSFFGRQLHVCYAPEYETVQDTRAKLQQRRIAIASKTRDTCSLSKEDSTNVSEMTVRQEAEPLAHVHDTQERTTKTVAETQTGAGLMQDCSVTVIPGFPPLPDLPCPYNPQQGFVGGGLLPLPNPYLPPPNTSSYDSEVTCSSNSSKVHNTAHQRRVEYETSTKGNSVQKKPSSGLNKEERISLHLEMVGDGVSSTQFSMHQHHTPATSTSTATPPHPVRSDSHRTKPMTVGKKRPLVTETDAKQPSKVPSRVPSLEISTGSTSVDQTVQSVRQKMMKVRLENLLGFTFLVSKTCIMGLYMGLRKGRGEIYMYNHLGISSYAYTHNHCTYLGLHACSIHAPQVWVEPSLNIPSPSPKQKKRKRI